MPGFFCYVYFPLLSMCSVAGVAHAQAPDVLWRFEDDAHIGADSVGKHPLAVAPPSTPRPAPPFGQETAGGCVGGYLHVGGENTSLSLSAQTATSLPAAVAVGLTVELLFRLPDPNHINSSAFNKAANTTILRGGTGEGDDGWEVTPMLTRREVLHHMCPVTCHAALLPSGGLRSTLPRLSRGGTSSLGRPHRLRCATALT
jgi:hypothetical protein